MLCCADLGMKIYCKDFKALLISLIWDGLSRSANRASINLKNQLYFCQQSQSLIFQRIGQLVALAGGTVKFLDNIHYWEQSNPQ